MYILPIGLTATTKFIDPDNEGVWMSDVAKALGIGGMVAKSVPHWAAQIAAAVLGGASAGIKVGVKVKGDSMIKNPYYVVDMSNQYYWISQGVAYYS